MKVYYVYILAKSRNGALYIGVTSNLINRIWQHKTKIFKGFTSKYHVCMLVYYEQHFEISSAIQREKHLKEWQRSWKLRLIEQHNPYWRDLYEDLI